MMNNFLEASQHKPNRKNKVVVDILRENHKEFIKTIN